MYTVVTNEYQETPLSSKGIIASTRRHNTKTSITVSSVDFVITCISNNML